MANQLSLTVRVYQHCMPLVYDHEMESHGDIEVVLVRQMHKTILNIDNLKQQGRQILVCCASNDATISVYRCIAITFPQERPCQTVSISDLTSENSNKTLFLLPVDKSEDKPDLLTEPMTYQLS